MDQDQEARKCAGCWLRGQGEEGRGRVGPPQTTEGPGLHAVGRRECCTQEKSTTCTLRPHGAGWGRAEAERPARRRPLGEEEGLVSPKAIS